MKQHVDLPFHLVIVLQSYASFPVLVPLYMMGIYLETDVFFFLFCI